MDEILIFLLNRGFFLYKELGFRFVDSRYSTSFGGDSFVVLTNDRVRFRIIRDRSQLFGDFQPVEQMGKERWFSIDVVRHRVTGEGDCSSELNDGNVAFIRERISDIEEVFSSAHVSASLKELAKLEKRRAKEMFG